jgi:hypothetical protein
MSARNAIRIAGVTVVGVSAAGGVAAGLAATRQSSSTRHHAAANVARAKRLVDASDAERAALLARLGRVETLAAALPPLARYHAAGVSRWSPPKPRVVVLPPRVQVVYAPSPAAPASVAQTKPVSQAKPVTQASPSSGSGDDHASTGGGDG